MPIGNIQNGPNQLDRTPYVSNQCKGTCTLFLLDIQHQQVNETKVECICQISLATSCKLAAWHLRPVMTTHKQQTSQAEEVCSRTESFNSLAHFTYLPLCPIYQHLVCDTGCQCLYSIDDLLLERQIPAHLPSSALRKHVQSPNRNGKTGSEHDKSFGDWMLTQERMTFCDHL
jgi:hypothetical protein